MTQRNTNFYCSFNERKEDPQKKLTKLTFKVNQPSEFDIVRMWKSKISPFSQSMDHMDDIFEQQIARTDSKARRDKWDRA